MLYTHPQVADVAVIGLPDERTGERACAVVALQDAQHSLSMEELRTFLTAQGLRRQAVPEQLEIVAAVPRNPAGKILKHELRRQFSDG
ncbi:MAG: hypothetical protein WKF43_06505 [Acidimicrobiales bacterium]